MKKKSLILICSALAISSIGVFALLSLTNVNSDTFAIDDNHNHTVIFTAADVTPSPYDDKQFYQPFSLSKENAIVVSETEKYDLSSVDENTYYVGPETVTWGGDNIASIEASIGWEAFYFEFSLLNRATLDLSKCVVDYYINDVYNNTFFTLEDEGEKYNTYLANFDCYSNFGDKIEVRQVKLVFSC